MRQAGIASLLCALMVGQPLMAEAVEPVDPHPVPAKMIQGHDRVLHALNRFTFGPRPGDIAAVEAMGLRHWFELQLNPAAIDDSALEQRMTRYPAMSLTATQLQVKFPDAPQLRKLADGRASLPKDPIERAMVEDQLAFYKRQRDKKAESTSAANASAKPVAPPMAMDGTDGMAGMAGDVKMASGANPTPVVPEAPRFSHDEAMRIVSLEPEARFKAILALSPDDLPRFRQSLKPVEQLAIAQGMAPQEREVLEALPGSVRMIGLEVEQSRIERDLYSNRQLEAVLTDFWLNHFNVYLRKNQEAPYLLPQYERETIRPNVLGNFENLLVATAMSPAMLDYLDNSRSVGPHSFTSERASIARTRNPNGFAAKIGDLGLNENYARELMELHTLGVDGGYTQADVQNVAKIFTGWTVDRETLQFVFDERRHEPGSKTVLGKTFHENGPREAFDLLHMLATNPATAHFVCKKLAVRFVSDNPPPALVDRMAASFLANNGNIRQVIITMWNSPEFWSPDVYRAKLKTPEEFLLSAVRATGANVTNSVALVAALTKLGMPLYGMQTPNGYGWTKDDWVSTGSLVNRMNFAIVLSGDRIPGTDVAWDGLLGQPEAKLVSTGLPSSDSAATPTAKERQLEALLFGNPVSDRTRDAVLAQAGNAAVTDQAATQFDLRNAGQKGAKLLRPKAIGAVAAANSGPDDAQAAVIAGLLLGSPEFQRR
jgi:uncharacterized protein (DUF1800 family)